MQRADDPATWMEIYEGVDDPTGFQTALEEIVATSGLPGTLADKSARHIEHFREQR
ncbi:MAG: hypothetical protein JWL63_3145 [Rhodocyclales bacterium]|nr:hypothetical protein [Rhodocyclales bacterium]